MTNRDDRTMLTPRTSELATLDAQRASQGPRIEPFPTEIWEPLSRRQVDIGNQLLTMLPLQDGLREGPLGAISKVLQELTGIEHDVYVHAIKMQRGPLQVDLGHHFVTRFEMPPDPEFGVLSCDLNVVEGWMGALLGDDADPPERIGPLNEQDFGATTYVLLRVLDQLSKEYGLPPITLASSPSPMEAIHEALARPVDIAQLVIVVSSEVTVGTMRLWVPSHVIQSLSLFVRGDYMSARRRARAFDLGWGGLKTKLWASVGRVDMSRLELITLRPGDVLLPEHGVQAQEVDTSDTAHGRLYIQAGCKGAYLPATYSADADTHTWCVALEQLTLQHTQEVVVADAPNPQDNMKTQGLVDDARLPIEIRLGEVSVRFEQLAQLQPGHVLSLDKPLQSPVELVAQGRVVGTAELVNIEGRLGARVLTLNAR